MGYYLSKLIRISTTLAALLLPVLGLAYLFVRTGRPQYVECVRLSFQIDVAVLGVSYLAGVIVFFLSEEARKRGRSALERLLDQRWGIDSYFPDTGNAASNDSRTTPEV